MCITRWMEILCDIAGVQRFNVQWKICKIMKVMFFLNLCFCMFIFSFFFSCQKTAEEIEKLLCQATAAGNYHLKPQVYKPIPGNSQYESIYFLFHLMCLQIIYKVCSSKRQAFCSFWNSHSNFLLSLLQGCAIMHNLELIWYQVNRGPVLPIWILILILFTYERSMSN